MTITTIYQLQCHVQIAGKRMALLCQCQSKLLHLCLLLLNTAYLTCEFLHSKSCKFFTHSSFPNVLLYTRKHVSLYTKHLLKLHCLLLPSCPVTSLSFFYVRYNFCRVKFSPHLAHEILAPRNFHVYDCFFFFI